MTLLLAESCDNGSRTWTASGGPTWNTTGGRPGGGGYMMTNTSSEGSGRNFSTPLRRAWTTGQPIRAAFWWWSMYGTAGGNYPLFRLDDVAGTGYATVYHLAYTGKVFMTGWGSTSALTGGTSTINVCDGGWHYIEIEWYFHDTTGTAKMWIDGQLDINVSGDTIAAGTPAPYRAYCYLVPTDGKIDDVLVWDDAAGDDGFTGDLGGKAYIMKPLRPTSDASVQFTRSTGATNFSCVDEAGSPTTTDYVESAIVGNQDRYGFSDTGLTTETVKAVIVESYASNQGAGAVNAKMIAELSGTMVKGPARALIGSYQVISDAFLTKPGGGAWTTSDVEAATFGIEVA